MASDEESELRAELTSLRERVAALAQAEAALVACQDELAALRASEAELRAMFQAMTDVVLVMDQDGRYLKIGPTAPNLLYRPGNDLVGKRMHEVMPAGVADFFLDHIRAALESECVVSMDYSLPIGDDEVFFAANISPMSQSSVILVCRDITERKRLERREAQRQQELLRAQAAILAELSTPLIPISDEIVVVPLIGRIDAARMQQVMDTLLAGIFARRTRTAILDITGLPTVDVEVAAGLVRAARAVQLLGAEAVLTGIRPDVAQHLVALAADLAGVTVRGTLKDGIAYAMAAHRGAPARV